MAHSLVALRGEVEVVIQVLVGDVPIRVHEAWVYIEERRVGERGHGLLDQPVDLGVLLPQWVGQLTPGQHPLCMTDTQRQWWMPRTHFMHRTVSHTRSNN